MGRKEESRVSADRVRDMLSERGERVGRKRGKEGSGELGLSFRSAVVFGGLKICSEVKKRTEQRWYRVIMSRRT